MVHGFSWEVYGHSAIQEIPHLYGIQWFITVYKTARH
jgi:hypothetical protein